jgi:importin-5
MVSWISAALEKF